MATPDYLQQVIVSGRSRRGQARKSYSTIFGIFQRPSMTSLVLASFDLITVLAAGVVALRLHSVLPAEVPAFYVVFQRMEERLRKPKLPAAAGTAQPA